MAEWGVNDWTDGAVCDCEHREPFVISMGHYLDGERACESCGGLIP